MGLVDFFVGWKGFSFNYCGFFCSEFLNKYLNLIDLQWGVDDRRVRVDENSLVDIGDIGLKFPAILLALAVFWPARVAELWTALWPLPSFISWCALIPSKSSKSKWGPGCCHWMDGRDAIAPLCYQNLEVSLKIGGLKGWEI